MDISLQAYLSKTFVIVSVARQSIFKYHHKHGLPCLNFILARNDDLKVKANPNLSASYEALFSWQNPTKTAE